MQRIGKSSLRIIGGTWRGRTIRFPVLSGVRPTPDRVRETLFNWLGQDLTGWQTLEPYAGSGILSLEALSRGAALAVAWDINKQSMQALTSTSILLKTKYMEAHSQNAQAALAQEKRRFDLIFLDPPFQENPWPWLFGACAPLLKPTGYLYAEAGMALTPPAPFSAYRHGKAGQVHYHLFCFSAEEND